MCHVTFNVVLVSLYHRTIFVITMLILRSYATHYVITAENSHPLISTIYLIGAITLADIAQLAVLLSEGRDDLAIIPNIHVQLFT